MEVGRGNGKLILFGEHAAVYGHPALGMQIPSNVEVRLGDPDESEWTVPDLDEQSARLVRHAAESLSEVLGRTTVPRVLRIGGDLPTGVGFGSSAAFCIALLRAVAGTRFATTGPTEIWKSAHALERVFHGSPSGIDTGFSLFSDAVMLRPAPPDIPSVEHVHLPPAWIVAGAVPRTGSTAELVADIARRFATDPSGTTAVLRELGSLAVRAAATGGDPVPDSITQLGALAEQAHTALAELGLSTDAVEAARRLLKNAGAVGTKLSGAGGGGAFFGIFHDEQTARAARNTLSHWLALHHPLSEGPFAIVIRVRSADVG